MTGKKKMYPYNHCTLDKTIRDPVPSLEVRSLQKYLYSAAAMIIIINRKTMATEAESHCLQYISNEFATYMVRVKCSADRSAQPREF